MIPTIFFISIFTTISYFAYTRGLLVCPDINIIELVYIYTRIVNYSSIITVKYIGFENTPILYSILSLDVPKDNVPLGEHNTGRSSP